MTRTEEIKVFFSWQSKLDKTKNTNFIRGALNKSIKNIMAKKGIKITIDEATRGETGSPNISAVIQQKIPLCNIFIADVTIIGEAGNNNFPSPNPNVMFELGFAVAEIGWPRIISLMNSHFPHTIDDLPFDIKGQRISPYNSDEPQDKLVNSLTDYITAILDKNPKTPQELRGVSIQQIKHERDIKNIYWIMSYLYTPALSRLIDEAPLYIRGDIFSYWATFEGIINSIEFKLYDLTLNEIFNSFYNTWSQLLKRGAYFYEHSPNGVDHIFPKSKTHDSQEAREAWQNIDDLSVILKEKLTELINYIHSNYAEIDLDETNQHALDESKKYRPKP